MAFGLRAVRTLSSGPLTEAMGIICTIPSGYASTINCGDLVTLSGTGSTAGPGIVLGTAGASTLGVFWGITQTNQPGNFYTTGPSWVANTVTSGLTLCFVYMDPDIIYQVQTGNAVTGVVANDLGANANFFYAAGSNSISGSVLDLTTIATGGGTDTLNLKIWALADLPNNVFYAAGPPIVGAGNIVEVSINNHVYRAGRVGI